MSIHKQKYRLLKAVGLRQKSITKADLAICGKKKFFFIHVPKTAGKSIRFSLFGQANGARHCSAYHLRKCFPELWNQSFSFCFVRNPYDRLYSAFRYLLGGGNLQERDLQFRKKVLRSTQSFETFIHDWLDSDRVYSYLHFIPQYEFVYHKDKLMVDYVGRFETLSDDYAFLRQKIQLPCELKHLNSSRHASYADITDIYTTDMARKVQKVYEKDFQLFGYAPRP